VKSFVDFLPGGSSEVKKPPKIEVFRNEEHNGLQRSISVRLSESLKIFYKKPVALSERIIKN
jgi:hypothetical protein